jgi:8-oxo-dGTP diphosphatase
MIEHAKNWKDSLLADAEMLKYRDGWFRLIRGRLGGAGALEVLERAQEGETAEAVITVPLLVASSLLPLPPEFEVSRLRSGKTLRAALEELIKAEALKGARELDLFLIKVQRPAFGPEWNFPGGVVKQGEALKEAARRELEEEAGVEVLVAEMLSPPLAFASGAYRERCGSCIALCAGEPRLERSEGVIDSMRLILARAEESIARLVELGTVDGKVVLAFLLALQKLKASGLW